MQYMNLYKKDTLIDLTTILRENYNKLPYEWIRYFKVRISNLISYHMHWKNTYNLLYSNDPEVIEIEGFPPVELRRELNNWDTVFLSDVIEHHHNDGKLDEWTDVNLPQLDYIVHKMNYKQAVVFMRGKDIVMINFYKEWYDEEKPCAYIKFIQTIDDIDDTISDNENCNVLTPEETEEETCNCCRKGCPHRI